MSPERSLVIRPAALRDVEDHALFISDNQPDAARRFVNAFLAAADKIAETPGIGSPLASRHPRLQHLRKWPIERFTNFQVFYRWEEPTVEIIRVIHGAQDWTTLFSVQES